MRIEQLLEKQITLPKSVIKAFEELGDKQRGRPEAAMLHAQEAAGGGVLPFCLEHIGDLTHRMSHMVGWSGSPNAGYDMVADKIKKTMRMLTNDYGFEKEMLQNFKNNADYRNVPIKDFTKKVDEALSKYAHEHSQLTVYNRAQWLAREAAVTLGQKKFGMTIVRLHELEKMMKTPQLWSQHALSYRLDDKGEPIPYNQR